MTEPREIRNRQFGGNEPFNPQNAHRTSIRDTSTKPTEHNVDITRKVNRLIQQMTKVGAARERELLETLLPRGGSEVTVHTIDENMLNRIIRNVTEEEKRCYGENALREHIFIQITSERRAALEKLSKEKEIQRFYLGLYGRPLPRVQNLQNHEVSALVHEIVKHVKEWLSLPEDARRESTPVDVEKIFDNPDQLKKILRRLYSNRLCVRAQHLRVVPRGFLEPNWSIIYLLANKFLGLPNDLAKMFGTIPFPSEEGPILEPPYQKYLEAIYYHKKLSRAQELGIFPYSSTPTQEAFLSSVEILYRLLPPIDRAIPEPVDIAKAFDNSDLFETILESISYPKQRLRAQDLGIIPADIATKDQFLERTTTEWLALPQETRMVCGTVNIRDIYSSPDLLIKVLDAMYFHKQLIRAQELELVSRSTIPTTRDVFLERITQEWSLMPPEVRNLYGLVDIRAIYNTPLGFQKFLTIIYDHKLHARAQDFEIIPLDVSYTASEDLRSLIAKEWLSVPNDKKEKYIHVHLEEIFENPPQMLEIFRIISSNKQISQAKKAARNPAYRPVFKTRPDGTTNPLQTIRWSLAKVVDCQFSEAETSPLHIGKVIPDVVATPQGLSIRIPLQATNKGFHGQLQQCLQEKGIFLRGNPIDFSMRGATYVHEFMIPPDTIQKFFLNVLEIPKDKAQEGDQKNFFDMFMDDSPALTKYETIHEFTTHFSDTTGRIAIPDGLKTISLRLAQLDPSLTPEQLHSLRRAQPIHPIPIVASDVRGLTFCIPEGREDLRDSIERVFMLPGRSINEVHNGQPYSFEFRVTRDNIPDFLQRILLLNVPDRLPEDIQSSATYKYNHASLSYLSFLEEAGLYYRYNPQIVEGKPIQSIQLSVKTLVLNTTGETPLVTIHPRGWMSIRFFISPIAFQMRKQPSYLHSLLEFLERQISQTDFPIEIIIPNGEIERFVTKELKLPHTIYDQLVASFPSPYTPLYQTQQIADGKTVDVLGSIRRSLASLDTGTREVLKNLPPDHVPDPSLPLPTISVQPFKLKFDIPQPLLSKPVAIIDGKNVSFEDYIWDCFRPERGGAFSTPEMFEVPKEQIRTFLERDLKLHTLPPECQREGCRTYYNALLLKYASILGLTYETNGSVSIDGLKLKNPPLQMPEGIPTLSKEEVIKAFSDILKEHEHKETYVANFKTLLDDAIEHLRHPEQRYRDTATLGLNYLHLLAHEVRKEGSDKERALHTLVELGVRSAPNICFPGRVTNLQLEFQRFVNPATADDVRFSILQAIEELKTELLIDLMRIPDPMGRLVPHPQSVHILPYLQERWKDAMGFTPPLDLYAIGAGSYGEQMTRNLLQSRRTSEREFQKQFVEAYRGTDPQSPYPNKTNVFKEIYEKLMGDKDRNGIIINIGLYQERMRTILKKQSMQDDEIEEKISEWIPEVDGIQGKAIHPEAIELILADIGVLNP